MNKKEKIKPSTICPQNCGVCADLRVYTLACECALGVNPVSKRCPGNKRLDVEMIVVVDQTNGLTTMIPRVHK